MSSRISGGLLVALLAFGGYAVGADAPARTPSPEGAVAYFISPTNGAEVPPTFTVRFGLRGMGVAPVAVDVPKTGHHHLLVDVNDPLDIKEPIPQDKSHLHFGAGQTEARIELPPGKHTLQLVLGDAKHYPFDPPVVSKKITVTIK